MIGWLLMSCSQIDARPSGTIMMTQVWFQRHMALITEYSQGVTTINSLWPSEAIWWHRSVPTMAWMMACCLMAPSHYLTQYWLSSIRSTDIHQMAIIQYIYLSHQSLKLPWKLSNKIPLISPRGWRVKTHHVWERCEGQWTVKGFSVIGRFPLTFPHSITAYPHAGI